MGSNISPKVDKHKKGKFNNISEIAIVSLEPQHEISNCEDCVTSIGSDQPVHICSLIGAFWKHSGSVVECLTQDHGALGSSLTGVTALWSLSKTHLS